MLTGIGFRGSGGVAVRVISCAAPEVVFIRRLCLHHVGGFRMHSMHEDLRTTGYNCIAKASIEKYAQYVEGREETSLLFNE